MNRGPKQKEVRIYRIPVFGGSRVGKTALIRRFVNGTFPHKYKPTVEDCYFKQVKCGSTRVTFIVIDTSGTYHFPAMRDLNILEADKIILVYDFGDLESFEEVKRLYNAIECLRSDVMDIPITIVGNKIDLKPDIQGYVDDNVEEFLLKIQNPNCRHSVTSAKLNLNVTEAFICRCEEAVVAEDKETKEKLTKCCAIS